MEVYAVYRDGFQQTPFVSLEAARASLKEYKRSKSFYDISIYRKNVDGSIVWVE